MVFVRSRVPDMEIKMAPMGAVKTMLKTHIISTISA